MQVRCPFPNDRGLFLPLSLGRLLSLQIRRISMLINLTLLRRRDEPTASAPEADLEVGMEYG